MNFKFKRLYHRVFSIFLVIVLSVLSVPTSAVAKEGNEEPLNISTSAPISESTIATDLSQEVIWPVVSDEEAMRREQLIQNGYSPDDYSVSEYKQMAAKGELQPLAVYPAVLADGVYAIKNIGNSSGSTGFYLDTALAHWLPGYNMQQYKFENGTSPLDNFEVSTLFKITRNPSTGSYIIRIMRNNALSFGIRLNFDGSTEILSKKIPLDDSSVALTDTYSITVSGSGYKICKYGTTNLIAAKDTTASGAAGAPDSYLYASPEIGDHARWTFSAYTGPERNDITILGSGSLEVGKSSTLDPVFYSTRPGYNVVSLNMSQVPTSYYTLSGPSDYGIYSLTPHQGTAWNVGIYLKNGSSSTASSILVKNETWNIALPIDEGIYFFENAEFPGKYMQIDDDSSSSTNGAIMELWGFDGDDDQRWNLDHISDGYYKITSVASGKALTAPTSVNGSVTQSTYQSLTSQKWLISKNSNGTYCLKSSERYLAAGDGIFTSDGRNVEGRYEQSDAKDEWNLTRMLPTSGYEVAFNENLWNYPPVIDETNCYAYAINNQVNSDGEFYRPDPGRYAGISLSNYIYSETTYEKYIVFLVRQDVIQYNLDHNTNLIFECIEKYKECPQGTYKVALFTDPEGDYHWYRQDPDGLWSHKLGGTAIRRVDNSNKLIVDPQLCDRGDYTTFVGYFAVSPWSNYYNGPVISREYRSVDTPIETVYISPELLNQVNVGMTYNEVIDILKTPGERVGSGFRIYKYILTDGRVAKIWFYSEDMYDLEGVVWRVTIDGEVIKE